MDERILRYLRVVLVLTLGIAAFGLAVSGLAMADNAATAKTLDRDLEPVIVKGAAVDAFEGASVDQLFVYAYAGGVWRQIPAQVDEVTITGWYTSTEDGLLDSNDEIVFMAKDLGDQAQDSVPMVDGRPFTSRWYEIEVTDPTRPDHKGWAYLVHSSTLKPTFTSDYVNFNTTLHRIEADSYRLGFGLTQVDVGYLALERGSVNILDRGKKRLYCKNATLCPLTEETLPVAWPDVLIKDGPVRVILRGGRILAYGTMIKGRTTIFIPKFLAGDIRFSTDFNAAATGSTFYNAVVPDGVTVDGITDTVPAEPLSPWWQLSTSHGTLIQVTDTSSMGGTQSNYYVDDATLDPSDTGDQRHYGDVGIYVANPERSFTYTFITYFLSGTRPNVGETYAAYFSQPLTATAHLQRLQLPVNVYLPVVIR
jgi:hypothetical protein